VRVVEPRRGWGERERSIRSCTDGSPVGKQRAKRRRAHAHSGAAGRDMGWAQHCRPLLARLQHEEGARLGERKDGHGREGERLTYSW
jgi:hypothetical protein